MTRKHLPPIEREEVDEVKQDDIVLQCIEYLEQNSLIPSTYFPERYGLAIPKYGRWVMVVSPPSTEYSIPKLSIWYALPVKRFPINIPVATESGGFEKRCWGNLASIITPRGELLLFPHEYSIPDLSKYIGMLGTEHIPVRYMNNKHQLTLNEQVFYLRTRGIALSDAILMTIGNIQDPKLRNYCFFTTHDDYMQIYMREDEFEQHIKNKTNGRYGSIYENQT